MIALIGCSAKKLEGSHPARELYTSTLFRKSLAYAELRSDVTHAYVISAVHHLVPLDREIESYDFTLREMTRMGRFGWADSVLESITRRHRRAELLILAGQAYASPLIQQCHWSSVGRGIAVPMDGMQIGQRLSWLTHEIGRMQRAHARAAALSERHARKAR